MTYDEYLDSLRGPLNGERLGQRAFNNLHRVNPFLADQIRNETHLNPFHSNANMERFLKYVKENWDA